jgi:hypothetical protein
MNKTVKEFVELLEFSRKEKFSYRKLLEKFTILGWDKYFMYEEQILPHSRIQFIGLFSNGWLYKPVQVVVFTQAYKDDLCYCFMLIDEQLYQVAPIGVTSIQKG